MDNSRRNFVALAGLTPLALLLPKVALAQNAACYDPAALPLSQKNRRRSVGFTETSNDAKRRCGICAYFTAGQGNCGTCMILSGGPVNSGAFCTSFASRAA